MIQGILLSALGAVVFLVVLIVGVVSWVLLKLFKGELNLKIGNNPENPPNNQQS